MKLTDLTPEQKRIAIAEACPKIACKNINGEWVWREHQSRYFDPLSDLNAMHEAEKTLDNKQFQKWTDCLFDIQSHDRKIDGGRWQWLCSTAAQRADAFLLATGRATV